MKKMTIISVLAIACMLFMVTSSFAHTVSYVNNTTQSTSALTGYATNGAMMDGMTVTATFATGGTETAIWGDTGATSGAAVGTGWALSQSGDTFGDTFYNNWALSSSSASITSLLIDAGIGDTVFDIHWSPFPGTAGSAGGTTFSVSSTSISNIDATYIDMVALGSDAPVGDLWRYLNIDFTNSQTGYFGANDNLTYIADTDNLKYAGDIDPQIPEPGTMLLLGSGLLGLGGFRKKSE